MKYLNRDISWLAFNQKVADEAGKDIPAADKVMFHGITFSNLDEFCMVRYPMAVESSTDEEMDAFVQAVGKHYGDLVHRFSKFNKQAQVIRKFKDLKKETRDWLEKKFKNDVYPALQAITIDKTRPMNPRAGTYLFVITTDRTTGEEFINYVELPKMLGRFITIPGKSYVVMVDDLIRNNLGYVFRDRKIEKSYTFSILRSAEVYVQTHKHLDPYQIISETLKERERAWITRVEIGTTSKSEVKRIRSLLPITSDTLIFASSWVSLADLKSIPSSIFKPKDLGRKITPRNTIPAGSIFDYIRKDDRLVFYPYESYQGSMVRFLEEAADDPNVISIKISLYRVSDNSDIIAALLRAADKKKIVTVLVELKARFDEHHNLEISDTLREGGVRLVYTDPEMKTHAKVCLVTRKEKKGLRIYSQVGTGNYAESTAKQYTDYSYFTADQEIGYDLTRFFNLMTSDQGQFKSRKIIYAPYNMRDVITENIEAEIKQAKNGNPASIICKCNSFADVDMADKIVAAAKAGVKVTMIIRGACILQPMKNLKIYSIIGQFLEHSRVYLFGTGKKQRIYLGSADLMHRNLSLRNELLILIEQKAIRKRIRAHIQMYLNDTVNRREILPNYRYRDIKPEKGKKPFNAQQACVKEAKKLGIN